MENKIVLPFDMNPIAVMYHNLAFPLGIVQGNAKCDIRPWLCYKFINCVFNPNAKNKFLISLFDNWGINDRINSHQQIQLFWDSFDIIGVDIIQVLKNMIACGHYINGNYNEEFVPGKQAYGVEYYFHDFLLIGFDDRKKVFYSVGYLTKQFVIFEIPYTNMELALKSLANKKPVLDFYKYNTNADITINIDKMLSALQDYLSSTNSLHQYTKGSFYGLEAIDKLGEYCIYNCEQKNFDHRYTRGLMEHKHIMLKRIEYLCDNQYITDSEYVAKARIVFDYSTIIHNLGIRFKLLGDCGILQEIRPIIKEMKETELSYLISVKKELEVYNETNKKEGI